MATFEELDARRSGDTTIPGGLYQTANGTFVNANGEPIAVDPEPKVPAKPDPKPKAQAKDADA